MSHRRKPTAHKGPPRGAGPVVAPVVASVALVDVPPVAELDAGEASSSPMPPEAALRFTGSSARTMSLLGVSQALGQDRSVTLRWIETLGCPALRRADRDLRAYPGRH